MLQQERDGVVNGFRLYYVVVVEDEGEVVGYCGNLIILEPSAPIRWAVVEVNAVRSGQLLLNPTL